MDTATIPKRVFSSKLRLVFFVGLEGSGHRYMAEVFRDLHKSNPDIPALKGCEIARSISLPWSMSRAAGGYANARQRLREELQELKRVEDAGFTSSGTIVTVQRTNPEQLRHCGVIGELSYPNAPGPDKSLRYPDLQMLAEAAEEAGVDLRVVYLKRSAEELMISNTLHRHLQK